MIIKGFFVSIFDVLKEELKHLLTEANSQKKSIKAAIKKLKKIKPAKLDQHFAEAHEEAFEEIDCLDCANCCSTTSPIFIMSDIERLSKHLRMKPQEFIETYLKVDAEGDHVLQSSPCGFLGADNYCSVYEHRPRACREYPHTNRKRMHQILNLTERNAQVCPAVYKIIEKLDRL